MRPQRWPRGAVSFLYMRDRSRLCRNPTIAGRKGGSPHVDGVARLVMNLDARTRQSAAVEIAHPVSSGLVARARDATTRSRILCEHSRTLRWDSRRLRREAAELRSYGESLSPADRGHLYGQAQTGCEPSRFATPGNRPVSPGLAGGSTVPNNDWEQAGDGQS